VILEVALPNCPVFPLTDISSGTQKAFNEGLLKRFNDGRITLLLIYRLQ
jgi:hypothetical protein